MSHSPAPEEQGGPLSRAGCLYSSCKQQEQFIYWFRGTPLDQISFTLEIPVFLYG